MGQSGIGTLSARPDRIDFAVVTSGVVVTKFWSIEGRYVAPTGAEVEPEDFDLDDALNWCEEHNYTVRRWEGGARAFDGEPHPIRTRAQIRRRRTRAMRRAMRSDDSGRSLNLDFAFDG